MQARDARQVSGIMNKNSPTWLAHNSASGSNDEESQRVLVAALTEAGFAPHQIIDLQSGAPPDRAALEASGVGLLVIHTGDGSASAILSRIQGWQGDVLVLPGGTANLLARALHGEEDAVAIARRLRSGGLGRARRNCIRSSAGIAVIELLAGPGASWSAVREQLRDGGLGDVAGSVVEAAVQSTSGPMVRIVSPPLGREDGYAGVRMEPLEHGMRVSGYGLSNAVDLLKQGIALLRRNFRDGPHDELGDHASIRGSSSDGSPMDLMLDGELATGLPEEDFSLAPLEIHLLSAVDDRNR
jgi:hypothetical protein